MGKMGKMELHQETLGIAAPTAQCGHCGFTSYLQGAWSVENGRLVFRAAADPLEHRGPDFSSCCESDPVVQFRRIVTEGEPLTDEQVAALRASAESADHG
jgi:hypothetical protein